MSARRLDQDDAARPPCPLCGNAPDVTLCTACGGGGYRTTAATTRPTTPATGPEAIQMHRTPEVPDHGDR